MTDIKSAKKYILVADDDRFYSEIYKTKLTEEGYDVVVVSNGAEVLQSVSQRRPDLIVLDMVMPVMNGFEVLVKLKADPNFLGIPIIVLSSLGQEEDADRVKEAGATEYFVKTDLTISELIREIKKYCVPS